MTVDEQDWVVISRDPINGETGRVYAVFESVRAKTASASSDIEVATQVIREVAEQLLGRGRWAGLNPKIEPAPAEAP